MVDSLRRTQLTPASSRELASSLARALALVPSSETADQPNAKRVELTTHLHGELGAGKTTWVRWMLQALGVSGPIKSPSYALASSYLLGTSAETAALAGVWAGREAWHLDLYRMSQPEEWEEAGLRDLFGAGQLIFIEWPERAQGLLGSPDLDLHLSAGADALRNVHIQAGSEQGRALLQALRTHLGVVA